MGKALDEALAQIEKSYGSGSLFRANDDYKIEAEVIPTGCISLDVALGVGGLAKGRIVEIYGPEGCLDKDTFIKYEIRSKDGKRQNAKGGSIERLWYRFHQKEMPGRGNYQRKETLDSEFYASCVNSEGRIFQNKILDVVDSGTKKCFTLLTKSGQITATEDHKFFQNGKFIELKNLKVGDKVYIHNNTHYRAESPSPYVYREEISLSPNHPFFPRKTIKDGDKEYSYCRTSKSRAIAEAGLNNITLDEYKEKLKNNDLNGMKWLKSTDHVHHLDEDPTNNSLDNLCIISGIDHNSEHALKEHNNLRFMIVEDEILDIYEVGLRHTYDIKMQSPFNNFIADGYVVHNSGKSTLALHVVAEAQKLGGTVAYIDAEHALDFVYAKTIGVDLDNMYINQPSTGEEGLNILNELAKTGEVSLIVVDSVAALTPKAEIEGQIGDQSVGMHARMMSQAMRKITGNVKKSNTLVVFINQLREKIGVMFGSPETQPGGRALKFYSSVRLDVRKKEQYKHGSDIAGNVTKVKVVKNRLAPPYREAEFQIEFGEGISKEGDVLDWAVDLGFVNKAGSWYSYNDTQIGQGKEAAKEFLKDHELLYEELYKKIYDEVLGSHETELVEEIGNDKSSSELE